MSRPENELSAFDLIPKNSKIGEKRRPKESFMKGIQSKIAFLKSPSPSPS
jgi:hypothetical protein